MSDEDVNEILDGLNVPPKPTTPPPEKPRRTVNKASKKTSYNAANKEEAAIERLTGMSRIARVTVKPGTSAYDNLKTLLPLMTIYESDSNPPTFTMNKLPPLPKDGVFKKFGITYDAQDKNFYITNPSKLKQIDKIADKQSNSIVRKFDELNTEPGHDKKGVKATAPILAELLNEYFDGETSIEGADNGNLKFLPITKKPRVDHHVDILRSLLLNGKEYNPFLEVEPVIETPKPQPNAEEPQPNAEEPTTEEPTTEEQPQVVPANSGAIAKPSGDNRIVINPQALNDLQTNQAQQLVATEAINTELLNTKHQLEQQQKILEKQNEILTAKDEFEKKLLNDKKILRYIEAEDTFSFNELVNTIDEALSSPGKEADDFLIASAVQSVLNKRDALEKLRDNERRKKSSQWSKAKIKDIRVEVKRDNNISPLLARTIASIS